MIKKFKNDLKRIIDFRIDSLKKQEKNNSQSNYDFQQISKLFSDNEFIPFTAWSLSPSILLHILNDIIINDRKSLIEFGSGASTFYIAKLLKNINSESKFISVNRFRLARKNKRTFSYI